MDINIVWPVFWLQIVTVAIAMPLIWKIFISKLIKTLKKRDDFIRESIDKIEKDKVDIEIMKTDYVQKMDKIKDDVKEAMSQASANGEKLKQKMVDEAKTEGQKLIAGAKTEIENEKRKAIEDVKDAIVDISILVAEKTIKKKITKKEQLASVSKVLKDIEKNVN